MPVINVGNARSDVDIESELRKFTWYNDRWTSHKLIASSPFRDDNAPSFFVNLDGEYAGTWGDSGALGDEYSSGNFVRLLAYLRKEDEQYTVEYLLVKYGAIGEIKQGKDIRIALPRYKPSKAEYKPLDGRITVATSPYLTLRAIGKDVQERYGIGYNELIRGYTALPWHDSRGAVANVKYRSTSDKHFFYEAGGQPIGELVYGLYMAKGSEEAIVVEGEIDALSWATAGHDAIAVGSANVTRRQVYLIGKAGFKRIYLAADNDEQGRNLNRKLATSLRGMAELYEIDHGRYKDANEVLTREGVQELRATYEKAAPVSVIKEIELI